MRKGGVSFEVLKALNDNILRLDKDFAYLKHPS